jgi:hypothetical protein
MQYIATINTPGYLPDADGPALSFSTPAEAWEHLWDERIRAWDEAEAEIPVDESHTFTDARHRATEGSVTLVTPGYDGDHDLGLAYSVTAIPGFRCVDCGSVFDDTDAANAHWAQEHDR